MTKDAYRFIIPSLLFAAASAWFGLRVVTLVFLVLAAFVAYFFRNPSRQIPGGENLVVSPADGKIVMIRSLSEGRSISIFLNIFNVHVTRVPIAGKLEEFEYRRGKFKAAYDDEASRVNEQNILTIRSACGRVVVKQIAGLLARRVICWKRIGDHLTRGELFGLIRFGSRVDVVLPEQVKILVKVGDRVRGGSSVIGEVL
ncbi:MAG: phosphatidylserine decarboxylase family protein [Acidobacteriota bacterium]|jgi:phosphatidylserine decarboxylase